MKSVKVTNILNETIKASLIKCQDLSMAQFSFHEVVDLFKMSNVELGYAENHNLSACHILLEYLENNMNVIDLPRTFYPDEISDIVEISELDENLVKDSIKKFKENHK